MRARRRRHGGRRVHAQRARRPDARLARRPRARTTSSACSAPASTRPAAPTPSTAYDPKEATSGLHTFPSLAAGHYYVITQAFEKAGQGPVTVTLSTPTHEGDLQQRRRRQRQRPHRLRRRRLRQRSQLRRRRSASPTSTSARWWSTARRKSVSFDTSAADADNNVTCQAAPGRQGRGGALHAARDRRASCCAGIRRAITWSALLRSPQPGLPCDADPARAATTRRAAPGRGRVERSAAGRLRVHLQGAQARATRGTSTRSISAYRNRKIELCHNGIDDDGNGLIDCADPACNGVAGCDGAVLHARRAARHDDGRRGAHGQPERAAASGIAGYNTSCAKGGAKGMVVQLTVAAGRHGRRLRHRLRLHADRRPRARPVRRRRPARRLRHQRAGLRRSQDAAVRLRLRGAEPAAGHLQRDRRGRSSPAPKARST